MEKAEAAARIAELKQQLGQRLGELRKLAGVTQHDVARNTFIDRTYISHAERGLHMPDRAFWLAADDYLKANGTLFSAYRQLTTAQHEARQAELDELRARHVAESEGQVRALSRQLGAEALRCEFNDAFGPVLARHGDSTPSQPSLSLTQAYTVQVVEVFSGHDLLSRRHVLRQLSVLTGAALLRPIRQWASLLPVVPIAAVSDELDELDEAVQLFRRWDAAGVGGLKRKAVVGQLNAIAETVLDTSNSEKRRTLFRILAEFADLAGWMSFDQGLHGVSQRYYLLALHASREAGALELAGHVMGNMIKLSNSLGHYQDSLSLARAGLYALPQRQGSLVRAELLGQEAQVFAGLGPHEAPEAVRSIETCLAVWHERADEPQPDWLHHMTQQAEVDCGTANTYTQLALTTQDHPRWRHYADQAERYTLSTRQTRTNRYERSRIVDEIRLAKVRLAQREPVEAVNVATQALERAEQLQSAILRDWLLRFQRDLATRYATLPEAIRFTDQLREHLRHVTPARKQETGS